jgi:rod shape-determining protein MreC|tara:strand:+ start:150 stop:1370 length:1221 start_codon:yes stop_codon:yes gene_type:complete
MESSRDDFVIAIRSAFLKKGTQQRFSLLGLISFSIIFLILGSFDYKPIDYIKKVIKELVYTSSFIVSVPENFVASTYSNTRYHFTHYDSHLKMKNELDVLRSKDLSNKILTLENIKYKKLIDDYFVKDNETYAKVLIDKQSPFLRSVIINKGSKNNIKLGMIALDENYLVGKIVEVNYFTSRVLLISDINSKIPVSLQPGEIQAIMSGKDRKKGTLQYLKDKDLENNNKELLVVTSGAGGVFKSGIAIGKILAEDNIENKSEKLVHFYKDFSQLKYIKIASYTKERTSLDAQSKEDSKKLDLKIAETNQRQETLRILLEQKKIADEVRIKIEEENILLKDKNNQLEKEIITIKTVIKKNVANIKNIKFLELNLLHGHKCRRTIFNKLYKVNTQEYRTCVLNKEKKN